MAAESGLMGPATTMPAILPSRRVHRRSRSAASFAARASKLPNSTPLAHQAGITENAALPSTDLRTPRPATKTGQWQQRRLGARLDDGLRQRMFEPASRLAATATTALRRWDRRGRGAILYPYSLRSSSAAEIAPVAASSKPAVGTRFTVGCPPHKSCLVEHHGGEFAGLPQCLAILIRMPYWRPCRRRP